MGTVNQANTNNYKSQGKVDKTLEGLNTDTFDFGKLSTWTGLGDMIFGGMNALANFQNADIMEQMARDQATLGFANYDSNRATTQDRLDLQQIRLRNERPDLYGSYNAPQLTRLQTPGALNAPQGNGYVSNSVPPVGGGISPTLGGNTPNVPIQPHPGIQQGGIQNMRFPNLGRG